ncbi:MAG: sugar ABC transporter permease [Chloroflexota bacterium]
MTESQKHLEKPSRNLAVANNAVSGQRTRLWSEDIAARVVLLLPGVLVVLLLSVFPLIISLYLSVSRVSFAKGGIAIKFVGLDNFTSILTGNGAEHLLGRWGDIPWYGTLAFIAFVLLVLYLMFSYIRRPGRTMPGLLFRFGIMVIAAVILGVLGLWGTTPWYGALIFAFFEAQLLYMLVNYLRRPGLAITGLFFRLIAVVFASALAFLMIVTLTGQGNLPGTLVVTLVFVAVGVFFQYMIGLGLALMVTQELPGKRFFRVAFLLPMMITPVGIGFLFRMMADTNIGPIAPLWRALGLINFTWSSTAFGARAAVLVGDTWQWTPFMFIILLAALEAMSRDQIEAALVDGATRRQLFRYLILPQIIPVSITLVLIRTIEAFKIIDLPNILTGGGPGTATESLTLHAYNLWRGLELGESAAVSYILLIVVTFVATVYVNSIRRRIMESL